MPSFEGAEEEKAPASEEKEDETVGDYKDATVAENFNTLQTYVDKQFSILNKNLKGLPTKAGLFATIGSFIAKGFNGVIGKVAAIGRGITKGVSATVKGIGKVITAPIKTLGGVVAGPLKAIGKRIASPFKAVGAKLKSMNPFASSEKKKEERKERAKQKVMDKIASIIDKVWKIIEPFVEKVAFFMTLVSAFVIAPIVTIVATVLAIAAVIALTIIGLVLVYKWVKAKIAKFWNYVVSGELWEDIKKKIVAAWGWIADFGKWLWDVIVDAVKYLFVGMWVDLGKWVWD